MSKIATIFLISIAFIGAIFTYAYSKKVYVSDRSIQCREYAEPLILGSEVSVPLNCAVSFRIENLTLSKVNTGYEIKNVAYKPANKIQGGSIQFGFIESGSVELEPRESKIIKLNVKSLWAYEALKVKAWVKG